MIRFFSAAVLLAVFLLAPPAGAAQAPDEIVAGVDNVRNPALDYTVTAKVVSHRPNRPQRAGVYEVMMKGRENTIIKTMEPQTQRGQTLLMRGPDFWAFFPEVAKPIRISLQEKLTGDVANGDIARTNFAGDYTASLQREEEIGGKTYDVLELKARTSSATYGKIILWAQQGTFWPLKAEFYAISGRFLKTCAYEDYRMLAGMMRPSRLVLTDAVVKGQYSTIIYDNMTVQEIPEKYFSKEYLKKLAY